MDEVARATISARRSYQQGLMSGKQPIGIAGSQEFVAGLTSPSGGRAGAVSPLSVFILRFLRVFVAKF
jgi:hypothetical protein